MDILNDVIIEGQIYSENLTAASTSFNFLTYNTSSFKIERRLLGTIITKNVEDYIDSFTVNLPTTIFAQSSINITNSSTSTSISLASQTKRTFLGAPNGFNGTPSFRELLADDVPVLTLDHVGLTYTDVTNWNNVANGYVPYADIRTIQPNHLAPYKLQFGFTSYNNNNTAPWADYIHFGGYQDASAGSQNLLVVNRAGFGIRQYQGTFQANTPYTNFVEFWNTGNFTQANINSWNNAASTAPTSALTAGSVIFSNGTNLTEDNANFKWDNVNKRLGIGTSSPTARLHLPSESDGIIAKIGRFDFVDAWQSTIKHAGYDVLTFQSGGYAEFLVRLRASMGLDIGNGSLTSEIVVGGSSNGLKISSYDGIQFANRSYYNAPTTFTMNDVEMMRVGYDGKVRIGTNGETSAAKLNIIPGFDAGLPVLGSGSGSLFLAGHVGGWGTFFSHNSSTGEMYIQNQRSDGGSTVYPIHLNPLGGNVTVNTHTIWHAGNLINLSQLTNDSGYAIDTNVVHKTGDENIYGNKHFWSESIGYLGNSLWARGHINNGGAGMTFYCEGVDVAQIKFNGIFNFFTIDAADYQFVKSAGFMKNGSTSDHLLTGNGGHILKSDLTSAALLNYVTIDTPQTIVGNKTFAQTSDITFLGSENNHIHRFYSNAIEKIASGWEYSWYNTRWKTGNKRGGSTDSSGYSMEFSDDSGTTYTEKLLLNPSGDLKVQGNMTVLNNKAVWHAGNFTPGNYVPYTGATGNVDLGNNDLRARVLNGDLVRTTKGHSTINGHGYGGTNVVLNPTSWGAWSNPIGAIVIEFPNGTAHKDIFITIANGFTSVTQELRIHLYELSPSYSQALLVNSTNDPDSIISVRTATAPSGNPCVILNLIDHQWSYPYIFVDKCFSGYQDTVLNTWTSYITTDLSGFTIYGNIDLSSALNKNIANATYIPKTHPVNAITQPNIDGWNNIVANQGNYVPYTGATTNLNLNDKNVFNIHRLKTNGGIVHNSFGLSMVNSPIDNVGSVLIKTGMPMGNMGCYTVKLFAYTSEYYEFVITNYKYNDSNYFPEVTWNTGVSTNVPTLQFYKDSNNDLYLNIPRGFTYGRIAITDVMGYPDDNFHNSDAWQIIPNGDVSALTLEFTKTDNQYIRDWVQKNNAWHVGNFNPTNYVPYTGATGNVDLGTHFILAGGFFTPSIGQTLITAPGVLYLGNTSLASVVVEAAQTTFYNPTLGGSTSINQYGVTSNAFSKTGSNNNYILLGGGDHELKKTGFNKDFGTTVGTVAEGNHTHNTLLDITTGTSIDPDNFLVDNSLRFDSGIYDNTPNLFPTSNNANSIISLNPWTNNNFGQQLGFSSNGKIYYRNKLFNWSDWDALSTELWSNAQFINKSHPVNVITQPNIDSWNSVVNNQGNYVPYTGATTNVQLADKDIYFVNGSTRKDQGNVVTFTDVFQTYWDGNVPTGVLSIFFDIAVAGGATMFEVVISMAGHSNAPSAQIRIQFYTPGNGYFYHAKAVTKVSGTIIALDNISVSINSTGQFSINFGTISSTWGDWFSLNVEKLITKYYGRAGTWNKGWGVKYNEDLTTHTGLLNVDIDTVFEPKFTKNSGFNLSLGTTAGTVAQGDHTHNQYINIDSNNFADFRYTNVDIADINIVPTGLQGKIKLDGWYGINVGANSTYGTRMTIVGQAAHDKTQLYFNGDTGSIQYRKSWYNDGPWTSLRTIWDSSNLINVSQLTNDSQYLTAANISGLANSTWVTDNFVNINKLGVPNGVATLDSNGFVLNTQLPSYVDDVLEFVNLASFPGTGESGKIYIAIDNNKTYRWSGSQYVVISETIVLGTTAGTAFQGDLGLIAYNHSQTLHAPSDAQKNVKSDWNEASGDAHILNKPDLSSLHTHSNKTQLDTINQNLGTGYAPTFNGIQVGYSVSGYFGFSQSTPFSFLNSGNAQKILTGGILVSPTYQDDYKIPTNGIYVLGQVISGTGFKLESGLSTQFFKADGTLDSNTYLTAANISGLANSTEVIRLYSSGKNIDDVGSYIMAKDNGGWDGGVKPPASHNGFGVISMHLHTGDYTGQLGFSAADDRMYFRSNNSSGWNTWKTFWTEADFTSTNIAAWNLQTTYGNHANAGYAINSNVVHKTGNEYIDGDKDFTSRVRASSFMSNTGTDGGYENVDYVGGHNNIWRFNTAKEYGIGYYQGGSGDHIGFHFGNRNVPNVKVDLNGYVTANQFKVPSGAASQFLKADGSLDGNTYALSSAIPTNYVTENGVQTIYQTKTFDSSPIVPAGTLAGHAINRGQIFNDNGATNPAYYRTLDGSLGVGLKVKLPFVTSTNKMVSFTLRIYGSYTSYDINFSGYLYVGNWYLPGAIISVASQSINIKMGVDADDKPYVWIPDFAYLSCAVINVVSAYNSGDWNTGWEFVRTNDTPNLALDTVLYPNLTKGDITQTNINTWNDAPNLYEPKLPTGGNTTHYLNGAKQWVAFPTITTYTADNGLTITGGNIIRPTSGYSIPTDTNINNWNTWGDHRTNGVNNYIGTDYVPGGNEKPNSSYFGAGKLKAQMLNGGNIGSGSLWNDVLYISTYTGGDVKGSNALVFGKNAEQIGFVRQDFDSASWGTYREIYHTGNFDPSIYATTSILTTNYLPLTGGTLSNTLTIESQGQPLKIKSNVQGANYIGFLKYNNSEAIGYIGANGGATIGDGGDGSKFVIRGLHDLILISDSGKITSYNPIEIPNGTSGLHTVNLNQLTSYVPTNATNATSTQRIVVNDNGTRNPNDFLPSSNPKLVRFDFINASTLPRASGNYAGVMTFSPYDGTSGSTGDSSYQLAFANRTGINGGGTPMLVIRKGIDGQWANSGNTVTSPWYKIWSEADFSQTNINAWNAISNNYVTKANVNENIDGEKSFLKRTFIWERLGLRNLAGVDKIIFNSELSRIVVRQPDTSSEIALFAWGKSTDAASYPSFQLPPTASRLAIGCYVDAYNGYNLLIGGKARVEGAVDAGQFRKLGSDNSEILLGGGDIATASNEIQIDDDGVLVLNPLVYFISGFLPTLLNSQFTKFKLIHLVNKSEYATVNLGENNDTRIGQQVNIYTDTSNGGNTDVFIKGNFIVGISTSCKYEFISLGNGEWGMTTSSGAFSIVTA